MPIEQVAALCAICTAGAAFFLWIVRMVVKDAIRAAVNGFDKRIALMEQRVLAIGVEQDALHKYAHESWHEQVDGLTGSLVEAFKAGQESRPRA